eukprot:TRINITY_DN1838_c0_g1_i2.p1 TRINITY_DN1838_c0_g1~~TRINITY_DN1838_c0_g1_i2.p1  ORF type:complete len:178 (-),score=43.61 TRINITY_DN1838_c0_g1_i2:56-559(-)
MPIIGTLSLYNQKTESKEDNQKFRGKDVLAFMMENNDSENKQIFESALEKTNPQYNRVYIFLPLELNGINPGLVDRMENAKNYLQKYASTLDKMNYSSTYIISPTHDSFEKFKEIVQKYNINNVIFPKNKLSFNNWMKKNQPKTKGYFVDENKEDENDEQSYLLESF